MKLEQKRVHETLVNRLRKSCRHPSQSGDPSDYGVSNVSITLMADKLDAISEALAYIIEKKHAKRKDKVGRKKREA